MKSIKQQYLDLKEGKISQNNFMRSVRMSLPQYVSNVTSFNDTVKILKNKRILSESDIYGIAGDPEKEAAMRAAAIKKKYTGTDSEEDELEAMIKKWEEEESGKYTKFDDYEGGITENDIEEEESLKGDPGYNAYPAVRNQDKIGRAHV
jgi:hypothetical protein